MFAPWIVHSTTFAHPLPQLGSAGVRLARPTWETSENWLNRLASVCACHGCSYSDEQPHQGKKWRRDQGNHPAQSTKHRQNNRAAKKVREARPQ